MLRLAGDKIGLSATDLTNSLACEHLTQQRLKLVRGERSKPKPAEDPHAELTRERGDAHEAKHLARLTEEVGGDVVDLTPGKIPFAAEALRAGADRTAEAMRSGAALIFQAQFFDGTWQGRADFLRRTDTPSGLGDYSYELIDTKLARYVKPSVVHQLSLYNRMLGEIQDYAPPVAWLILGDDSEVSIELGRYAALHRHVVKRLEATVGAPSQETYPDPIAHCSFCDLADECRDTLRAHDHLSFVAGIRRDQRALLVEEEIETVLALAEQPGDRKVAQLAPERFELLRNQADLQVQSRTTRKPVHRHLEPTHGGGYARVPPPSAGDVFFDLEGDPFVGDQGIEYLWGWWTKDGYEHVWAHDPAGEKLALETFVDRVHELRAEHPAMHVFHYAPHELSKLRSLSIHYATREEAVDTLLRAGVLVDLYGVVRQGMQVGEESYSLKKLERHHRFTRLEKRVREGGGSIIAYENWLESGDDELLEAIRAYNEEDCRSTLSLRDWLIDTMIPDAAKDFGVDFADYRDPEPEEEREAPAWMAEVEELIERLLTDLPVEDDNDTPEQSERRLVAHMLLYHHREAKPQWWRYFELCGMSSVDLIDERDALGGLVRDTGVAPVPVKRSFEYRFNFPPQESKLGDRLRDPQTGKSVSAMIGDGYVLIRRGKDQPEPKIGALIGSGAIDAVHLRGALVDLANVVLSDHDSFAVARSLLRREQPRLASGRLGETRDELVSAALGLDSSVLPIQGPPGTGKTYYGARMVVEALEAGRRVGVTAQSHAAIQNLLHAIEEHAYEEGAELSAIYGDTREDYVSPYGLVEAVPKNEAVGNDHQLVAGTAWLFAREEYRNQFDLVFIDEAGQFSLANAAVVGTAAKNLVLLGDPQQLPQVTQASHPGESGASVLEHVLEGESTIPSDRGVLLTESWRMHPDVCEFVSERSYDSRLRSRDACSLRRVDASSGGLAGAGLRLMSIEHTGRSQASPEESEAIAEACHDLLVDSTVTDSDGATRKLEPTDIMVVAPYNLAVHSIIEAVPDGVRVGTVDRFQGQEAPVVFYAMTCSAGEDVPRGLDFLFSKNRLNVAVSRAQCLAVLVYSPKLLDAECRGIETMELVDGVCRLVEMAE